MPRKQVNGTAAVKKPRAPKGGHKLAAALPEGEILTDFTKKQWRLGKPVGSGGFGLLYLASPEGTKNADYVLKVEPHSNGPLFCELHFYQRVAKPDTIHNWMTSHKQKSLGVPKYIASGTYERNSVRYRFMVMERFGSDLQKLFEENGKRFPRKTVLTLAIRLLDALEFIHSHDYVHADIKASNLLLGYAKGTTDQVYLVDYGLAYKYVSDGKHKDYKEDPKRRHDGTIEFTSIDAHKGVVPSRRGDLEILGYCLVQWLCSKLPWEDKLDNKDYVQSQKIKYMDNLPAFMKACFPSGAAPEEMQKFLAYVHDMEYIQRPDYNFLRQLFRSALKKNGYADDGKLDFTSKAASPKKTAPSRKPGAAKARRLVSTSDDESEEDFSDEVPPPKASKTPRGRAVVSPRRTPKGTPKSAAARARSPAQASPVSGLSRVPKTVPASRTISPSTAKLKSAQIKSPGRKAVPTASGVSKVKRGKRVIEVMSTATQTSPGLKGLKRSRKN